MGVSIVVGGQYGSEGKGKVVYWWAKRINAAAVVRVGGSNSGHTVYDDENQLYAFKMLPTSSLLNSVVSVLPAGTYIDLHILFNEIACTGISKEQLKIDPNAVIIKDDYKDKENAMGLKEGIGSTLSGTGAAVMERIKRDKNSPAVLAKDVEELTPFLTDTKTFLRELLNADKQIVIEGTQGYGLSNYHSKGYPYATSRDTTAAGFLAETGLSPFDVEHIVMVIRAFPIRVSGNSGPLKNEIDWSTVSRESGSEMYFEERTTVTKKIRRVARFDAEIVKEAIAVNQPDILVMNHVDYIDFLNKNSNCLSEKQCDFVHAVEEKIGRKIDLIGNGGAIIEGV